MFCDACDYLSLLQQNDNNNQVPRTAVASLIAAQRSNLIKQRKDDLEERNGVDAEMETVENEEDENEKSGSDSDSEEKSGSDSESGSDSDDDIEKVDDADEATRMESDMLRKQEGKEKKKKPKRGKAKEVEHVDETEENSTASSDGNDVDDGDSDDEKAPPVDSEAETAPLHSSNATMGACLLAHALCNAVFNDESRGSTPFTNRLQVGESEV